MNHQSLHAKNRGSLRRFALVLVGAAAFAVLGSVANAASTPPKIVISNVPLVLVQPTDPEVLLVVPNSQSMDGDLSGAIMTGSGTVNGLQGSSSPVDYTVPAGFSPPVASAVGGLAAYTVKIGRTLYDNSASRLNVAKQSIQQVIQQYAANFDFGLMTYHTGSPDLYTTWVYYMSGDDGFSFGDSTTDTAPAGAHWVANPCYQSSASYCARIENELGVDAISQPDMAIAASSDDPDINDVLYDNNISTVCMDYGGHSPTTPFPPYRSLSQYNNGSISVRYNHYTGYCAGATGPTNAGYVPYSDQVMYAERGFGFYVTSQSANKGDILVGIAPAATGAAPSQAQITNRIAQFTPYLKPETDSRYTDEIKALAVQSPIAGLMSWADEYYTQGVSGHPKPKSNTGCTPNRYVVMLTDGLPTEDLAGHSWPPLGTISSNQYGVHATFDLKGGGTVSDTDPDFANDVINGLTTTLHSTNDQALEDTINQLEQLKTDKIQVYIVGMGAGVDPAKNPAAAATMKAMAMAGGTSDYFPGVTPQDVVNDMQAIFAQIQAANQSTTTVAVNSTSYQSNAAVYQARFDTASFGWTGDLVAYKVNPDGTVDQNPGDALWDARTNMESRFTGTGWDTTRLAVTVNASSGKGVAFRWGNLSTGQQSALEAHWDSLTVSEKAGFSNQEGNYGQAVLDYLRGDQSRTQKQTDGVFRNRSYLLGDIVDSMPLYVGAPHAPYPGTSYAAFATAQAARTPVIYVGANDGAVHAFAAPASATAPNAGEELFAFFPLAPFDRLADLSQPDYNANHQFFVDGSPNAGDVRFSDGQWHTLLVGGLNAGGEGIYAMDVTHPSGFTSETAVAADVLWDITDKTSGFSHLGLTYSQPQIAQIDCSGTNCNSGGPTFVVIFGSGYNNDNGEPYLYVVNAQTGALIRSIDLCSDDTSACDNSLPNGLSTPLTVSSTGSAITDRAYAGDLQGNLWRIDLSASSPSSWSATVLFTGRNDSGDIQPITTQPAASFAPSAGGGGIMLYFGTGRYLGQPDIDNDQVQSFYGVLDRNSTADLPLASSDLATYALNAATVGTPAGVVDVRTISGGTGTQDGQVEWTVKRGWKMNLPEPGERSITNPIVSGGRVIFTTFTPSTAICGAGGSSWLMIVNYAGGELPGPELDINDNGQLGSGDQTKTGANPVGMDLGVGYAAAPTLMANHHGPFNDNKLITVSGKPIKSVPERGLPKGVLSWSEIR
ncbi:MAG: pilus assembly protein [Gammaproteobacteria bacterium]